MFLREAAPKSPFLYIIYKYTRKVTPRSILRISIFIHTCVYTRKLSEVCIYTFLNWQKTKSENNFSKTRFSKVKIIRSCRKVQNFRLRRSKVIQGSQNIVYNFCDPNVYIHEKVKYKHWGKHSNCRKSHLVDYRIERQMPQLLKIYSLCQRLDGYFFESEGTQFNSFPPWPGRNISTLPLLSSILVILLGNPQQIPAVWNQFLRWLIC